MAALPSQKGPGGTVCPPAQQPLLRPEAKVPRPWGRSGLPPSPLAAARGAAAPPSLSLPPPPEDRGRTPLPALRLSSGRGGGCPRWAVPSPVAAGGRRPPSARLPVPVSGSPAARSARSGRAWGSCCCRRRRCCRSALAPRPEARPHSVDPGGEGGHGPPPRGAGVVRRSRRCSEARGARWGLRPGGQRLSVGDSERAGKARQGKARRRGERGGGGRGAVCARSAARPPAPGGGGGWMRHGHAGVPGTAAGWHRPFQQHQLPRAHPAAAVHVPGGHPPRHPAGRGAPSPPRPAEGTGGGWSSGGGGRGEGAGNGGDEPGSSPVDRWPWIWQPK